MRHLMLIINSFWKFVNWISREMKRGEFLEGRVSWFSRELARPHCGVKEFKAIREYIFATSHRMRSACLNNVIKINYVFGMRKHRLSTRAVRGILRGLEKLPLLCDCRVTRGFAVSTVINLSEKQRNIADRDSRSTILVQESFTQCKKILLSAAVLQHCKIYR